MNNQSENSRRIWGILMGFSLAFIIGAVCAAIYKGELSQLIPGFLTICTRPSQFTMDDFVLGSMGGAFLNTGMVGLACCMLLKCTGATCTAVTIAAYWLNVGFATFGMTFSNIWPFFFGVFIYSRLKKVSFGSVANMAMFCTCMGPFASELLFRYPFLETRGFTLLGLVLTIILGVFVGCVLPPLIAEMPNFHKGYDLYNAAPAAGFLAFLIYCVLFRSPGIETPSNTNLGPGERLFVTVFFLIVFGACFVYAYILDHDCFKQYKALWKHHGHKTDFVATFGLPATIVNMGMYGMFILLYYTVIHGFTVVDGNLVLTSAKFTGATMGAIMCMYAFVAQGAQPRTVFPIAVGYAVASLYPLLMYLGGVTETVNWGLTTQGILVGMCFASGLAPVSGKYGFWAGVIAGAMHAILVTSVPLWHGGFCLYNGGFTCGLVAFILVPVLNCYFGSPEEREAKKAAK